MGGRVRGERRISALPMTPRRDSREEHSPRASVDVATPTRSLHGQAAILGCNFRDPGVDRLDTCLRFSRFDVLLDLDELRDSYGCRCAWVLPCDEQCCY